MTETEKRYHQARDAWINARNNYKRALNNLARQMMKSEETGQNERGLEWHFNYAYNMYQPVAKRYLEALKAYKRERPELTGRLMYDYLQEVSIAQTHNRTDISNSYMKSIEKMAVDSAKVAYADWVRNGNGETMAGVFTAIADAQMLDVDRNPEVKKIAQEVFDHYQQGKVKRDPNLHSANRVSKSKSTNQATRPQSVKPTPKVPSAKRRRPGPSLWIHKTIPY